MHWVYLWPSIVGFAWVIAFDCACGLALKFGCGFRISFDFQLWLSIWLRFWVVGFAVALVLQFSFVASIVVLALCLTVPLFSFEWVRIDLALFGCSLNSVLDLVLDPMLDPVLDLCLVFGSWLLGTYPCAWPRLCDWLILASGFCVVV